jgi:hypothetical protein
MASGAVLQVSVCSLLGRHGPEAEEAAAHLVRTGLAYLLASDGHGGARGHTLADGIAPARAAGASAVQAWQLTSANPTFLLRHGIAPEPARGRAWSARAQFERFCSYNPSAPNRKLAVCWSYRSW